ncbi:MAG: pilus assembly protein CpaB [Actinomycetota bacterium]|jgi:pilus assembly protein CpaB|nr:pilus assembly protein CpaB [Actinomycetota bacterium]
MKSRSSTIIGAGVALAILGAALVFLYAHSLQGSAGAATGTDVAAFVAKTAIPSGTTADSLTTYVKGQAVPASARPADALTSLSQIANLQTLRNISAGEVVAVSQFGTAGAATATTTASTDGLAIPAGKNAITVTAPVPQAVAGYVSAGDLVNIYMTGKGDQSARLLLSHVAVLAVVPANTPKIAAAAPPTTDINFTLALSPQDAEKVIFAQTYEALWYGLVHPGDGPATSAGQTLKSLFVP